MKGSQKFIFNGWSQSQGGGGGITKQIRLILI